MTNMPKMKVLIRRGDDLVESEFSELRRGDVFKMLPPVGVPCKQDTTSFFRADSDPIKSVCGTWGIIARKG